MSQLLHRERCLLGGRPDGARLRGDPRLRTAALRRPRRARIGARRRAQHRPRGDDADGCLRGLRRRLPRRQRVARLRRRHARRSRLSRSSMVLFCVRWGLDQIVVGIAITLTCEGATALIFESEFAESRPALGAIDKVAIPGLAELPVVGGKGESNGSIFTQPLVVYVGLGLTLLVAWMLRRTHAGPQRSCRRRRAGCARRRRCERVRHTLVGGALRRRDGGARRRVPLDRRGRGVPGHASSGDEGSSPSSSRCSPAGVRSGS